MSNIIKFDVLKRKGEIMNFANLVGNIEKYNLEQHEYTLVDMSNIANDILYNVEYYSDRCATPIVKIVKGFGFQPYKETMEDGLSGDIYINGDTYNEYGHAQVILVNKKEELFHQRFVMAHELGHYLFDFLGNPKYYDKNIKFTNEYRRDQHETLEEKRANLFAANLLMPRNAFIKQYRIALNADKRPLFLLIYLSKFFEVTIESVERRIIEVFN